MPLKTTPELFALTIVTLFTGCMWIPYILARMTRLGLTAAIGNPNPNEPKEPAWTERAKLAHRNAVENLVVFAPMVLALAVSGVSTPTTIAATYTFLVTRMVHYVVYTLGIPVIRTAAFLIGWAATMSLGLTLLQVI
jgi:uncharacterized MAPEG superfamily protein